MPLKRHHQRFNNEANKRNAPLLFFLLHEMTITTIINKYTMQVFYKNIRIQSETFPRLL